MVEDKITFLMPLCVFEYLGKMAVVLLVSASMRMESNCLDPLSGNRKPIDGGICPLLVA